MRDPATSNRHRRPVTGVRTGGRNRQVLFSLVASSLQCAGRRTTPSGTTPSRTKRHRAISSLRAKATIIFLAQPGRVLRARSEPLGQATLLLVVEQAPGELNHSAPHPSKSGSGKPLLAAC